MKLAAFLSILMVALAPTAAQAQDPPAPILSPTSHDPDEDRSWYGWKTFGVDAVWMGAFALGVRMDGDPALEVPRYLVYGAALSGYLVSAPLVHLSQGNRTRAAASLGIRVGVPLLGAAIGYRLGLRADDPTSDARCPDCPMTLAAGFATLGAGVAMLVDGFGLAWEHPEAPAPAWTPTLAPGAQGGLSFGVAGTW